MMSGPEAVFCAYETADWVASNDSVTSQKRRVFQWDSTIENACNARLLSSRTFQYEYRLYEVPEKEYIYNRNELCY
jgi:hypothetical protein